MALVVYFVVKLVHKWWKRLVLLVVLFGISFLLRVIPIPVTLRISLGYVITAMTILFPIVWYLIRTRGQNMIWVLLSFSTFGVAVFFRSIDLKQDILPMGTHWLWHLFGGVAVHFLITYIFKDNLLNLSANSADHD